MGRVGSVKSDPCFSSGSGYVRGWFYVKHSVVSGRVVGYRKSWIAKDGSIRRETGNDLRRCYTPAPLAIVYDEMGPTVGTDRHGVFGLDAVVMNLSAPQAVRQKW